MWTQLPGIASVIRLGVVLPTDGIAASPSLPLTKRDDLIIAWDLSFEAGKIEASILWAREDNTDIRKMLAEKGWIICSRDLDGRDPSRQVAKIKLPPAHNQCASTGLLMSRGSCPGQGRLVRAVWVDATHLLFAGCYGEDQRDDVLWWLDS